jgi:hypothetical protein
VRTDGDIEILGQQIDLSACHVLDEVDPWVFLHEAHDDVAKGELCRTYRRCESYDADEFSDPLPRMRLGLLGRSDHEQGVPVEVFACLRRAEVPRGAIEQANAERRFQLLHAITQCGLGHAETSTCGCEAAPVDDLHEVEKVIKVEHRPHPVGGAA